MSIEFFNTDLEKVECLCNLLVARATGQNSDTGEYRHLRHELLSNPTISEMLPNWIKLHRDLDSFWGFIKPKYDSYAERRTFISEEFSNVVNYLEFGNTPNKEKFESIIPAQENIKQKTSINIKSKVFIVHGHDNEAKQEVARYIESLGLVAIILHEQASSGMTIIEKIEYYSNEADFALVLYTACDRGRGATETKTQARNRARQNVIFEHGYLMAKLGRKHVCALVKGEIETPNDISGVVYVSLDELGSWKMDVLKELKACGYQTK